MEKSNENESIARIVKSKDQILNEAIAHYGITSQVNICVQECAELIQMIDKIKRHFTNEQLEAIKKGEYKFKDVHEALLYCNACSEIADVKVTVAQLEKIFSQEHIDLSFDRKIERLDDRIQKEKLKT